MEDEPMERPGSPEGGAPASMAEGPNADASSAAYLPYDDVRLWVRMPDTDGRPPKKRRPRRKERVAEDGEPGAESAKRSPGRALLLGGMIAAAAIVAFYAVLPGLGSGNGSASSTDDGASPVAAVAPPSASDLRTIEVTKKRVMIGWTGPETGGPFRYVVYRDSVQIGETSDPLYVDEEVAIDNYYRYVIIVLGPEGTPSEPSSELLVPILRRGEPLITPTLAPLPPPVYVPPATTASATRTTAASPTKTPPPSPLKTPSPSVRTIYETQYVTTTQTIAVTVTETVTGPTVTETSVTTVTETITVAPTA